MALLKIKQKRIWNNLITWILIVPKLLLIVLTLQVFLQKRYLFLHRVHWINNIVKNKRAESEMQQPKNWCGSSAGRGFALLVQNVYTQVRQQRVRVCCVTIRGDIHQWNQSCQSWMSLKNQTVMGKLGKNTNIIDFVTDFQVSFCFVPVIVLMYLLVIGQETADENELLSYSC